jgi:hypothetical protein
MKAHIITNGVVTNTIEVDSLDFMPGLIEATEGGIGWSYADGVFTPPVVVRDIKAEIAALEATVTPRRIRESILGTDNGWLAGVDAQISALRAQL